MLKRSTWALAPFLLAGCSSGHPEAPPPAPPVKTVFDPLAQQLDRARGAQQAADANADRTRAAVDKQERGDDVP